MTLEEFRCRHAMLSIDIAGVAWRYVDAGSGPCVVLLPGAQGTAEIFHKQFALTDRLRLVSVTYPAETDGEKLADGMAAFLDSLAIAQASVVGTSLGGYVAQLFGRRHAARVDRLILTCTFVDPGPVQSPDKLAGARDTPADSLKEQALARVRAAPPSELRDIQLDLIGEKQEAALLRSRMLAVQLAAPVPALDMPQARITVIDCDNDPVIPAPVRAAVRARYPQAEAHNLSGGGHYPYILCADEYNHILAARLT